MNIKDSIIKNLSPQPNINNSPSPNKKSNNHSIVQQFNDVNVFNPKTYQNKTAKIQNKYINMVNQRYEPNENNNYKRMQNTYYPQLQMFQQQNNIQEPNYRNINTYQVQNYQNEANNQRYQNNTPYEGNFVQPNF